MNEKLQRGFTLVELMVSLTIGLVILLVITQVYMSSFSVKRTQDDATQLTESARFAFGLISREIKMAGFSNVWEQGSTGSRVFCSTLPVGPALAIPNQGAALTGLNDISSIDPSLMATTGGTQITVPNSSDALRISFYGESSANTSPVADCHGYPVAANTLVNEVLFIATDPSNGEPALYCYTDNPTPATATHPGSVPLVPGVESMQFLYGEDTTGAGMVTRYLPWAAGTTVPDHVVSVKASLVVRSPNNVTTDMSATAKVFKHFDNGAGYPAATNSDTGAIFTAPVDRKIRQLVATEVATRNVCK